MDRVRVLGYCITPLYHPQTGSAKNNLLTGAHIAGIIQCIQQYMCMHTSLHIRQVHSSLNQILLEGRILHNSQISAKEINIWWLHITIGWLPKTENHVYSHVTTY